MSDRVDDEELDGSVVKVPAADESSGSQHDSGSTNGHDQPKRESASAKILNFIAGSWIFVVGGLIWLYNTDISPERRNAILIAIAALAVTTTVVWIMWARRFTKTVLKAAAGAFLVGLVALTALVPVILLGESDRILFLKLGAIAFLALFPGLLYLQFVATKEKTLRDEYVLNLHKLRADTYTNLPRPPRGSLSWRPGDNRTEKEDRENLYMRKFDAIYGFRKLREGELEDDQASRGGGSLLPIGLCTVLLAVGWALTLQPEPIVSGRLFQTVTISGRPLLPVDALRFGFLGAYVFIIEMLTRRYFQDDLKTGAYLNGATRILASTLLITALHQVWPNTLSAGQEVAFAFVIGVFPIVGLKAIQSLIALPLRSLLPSLKKEYPLSDLDGLNIWYESRLLEEGIEDMQNLATANIVDVMLRTRVPVDRLVDWIDQAILDLRVKDGDGDSARQTLRRLGIRTATDLEDALQSAATPDTGDGTSVPIEPTGFLEKMQLVLNQNEKDEQFPSITVAIWKTLAREPNLYHVREWKAMTKDLERTWSPERAVEEAGPEPPLESFAATKSLAR